MAEFKKEERYIVIKRKRLSFNKELNLRQFLFDNEIDMVESVVIEADDPAYDDVWKIIQNRVEGKPTQNMIDEAILKEREACANLMREFNFFVDIEKWHNMTKTGIAEMTCLEGAKAILERSNKQ